MTPRAGDVVFGYEATIGEAALLTADHRWCLGRRVGLLRPRVDRIDPRFLAYAWYAPQFQETLRANRVGGTTIESIRLTDLPSWTIQLPNLDEQHRIAGILGALDDKIELNRRMSKTLEATVRALFKSWFSDFDPVHAKAEGRDTGLPSHLADLFPNSFEDSELGEIPTGWGLGRLGDIAEVMLGGDWGADTPSSSHAAAVRCLRGVDLHSIRATGWSDAPIRYVSEASLAKREPKPTDVIVEGSGECGRSLAAPSRDDRVFDEPIVYSNFCKRLRTTTEAHALYLEFILNGLVSSGDMKTFVTGTAMPNLDVRGLLAGVVVVLPPDPVIERWAEVARLARAHLYSPENRTLAGMRDALLPKLMSGEPTRLLDIESLAVGPG